MTTVAESRLVGDGFDAVRLLRAAEVAGMLDIPVKRVYELPIRRVRIGRRSIRFRLSDVVEFLERRLETT